jgi:archaellum component FlaC
VDWGLAGGWATFVALVLELILLIWAVAHHFAKLNTKIESLEGQYKPNGGSSMRDAINRIEATIVDVQQNVHKVDTKLAKLEGKFEQHIEENNE